MANNVRESKGIRINGTNLAWGGYAFSANYNVSFNSPSRCSISFMSESGTYNEAGLKARIGGTGAKKYDFIYLGEWGTLKMYPLSYTVQEQPSGNILQITYYDRSINFLDKYFVLLDKRNVPTKAMNEKLRVSLEGDKHVFILGNEYVKDAGAKSIKRQTVEEQAMTIRGEMLYTASELADAIQGKGRMGGKFPVDCLNLLREFGIINRDVKDDEGKPANTDRAGKNGQGYLYGFNGSMRNVLNSWGSKLGFAYYWHPIKDKLQLMDLRAGFPYKDMETCINSILNKGKNIVGRNYTYSIEDTFSQGASAYFGRDGEEDGKQVPDEKYLLDFLLYPALKCFTEEPRTPPSPPAEKPNEVFYDYKYLPQTVDRGSGKTQRREWAEFYPDRAKSVEFMDYIRLVKAAALGPDFFSTYVLMKKIAEKPFQGGSGPNADPVQGAAYPGETGTDTDDTSVNAPDTVSRTRQGVAIEDALDQWTVVENLVVSQLYFSSGETTDKDGNTSKLLNKQDESGNWVYGKDCLSARLLNPALQVSSQIKSDLNVKSALQGILDQVFYGDSQKPNYWSFGPLEGEEFDYGTGPLKDVHDYPLLNRIFLAKVSDNGISNMLKNSTDNHQYNILAAVARAAGRFYAGKDIITPREFRRRNYIEDSPSIYYKNLDVKDTPLSDFYEAADLTHGAAAKAMPNSMIAELKMHDSTQSGGTCNYIGRRGIYGVNKDRPSKEKDFRIIDDPKGEPDPCDIYKGDEFIDPKNTARPTLEQFICSVYAKIRDLDLCKACAGGCSAAQFSTTVPSAPTGNPDEFKLGESVIYADRPGCGYASPVDSKKVLEFIGIAFKDGNEVEVAPLVPPEVTVNLSSSGITTLDVTNAGIWSSPDAISFIRIVAKKPVGGVIRTNLFGNQPGEVAKNDSIRKVNIDERNNTKIGQCCEVDLDPSVMLFDEGEQLVIPDLIKPHVQRLAAFGNTPVDFQSDNLQTYLKDSFCVLLPYLYTIEELNARYGTELEGTENAQDELDWIVDQVQLGGVFADDAGGADFPNFTLEADEDTGLCGAKPLVYLMKGDRFEYTHIIRPEEFNGKPRWGTLNVREDQFGSPKGQFLTPSLDDLGIGPEECCPGDEEDKEKCKKDREEKIKEALINLCRENAFDQEDPRNGLTVTLAGSAVTDENGKTVPISTAADIPRGYPSIEDGLEKLDVQIGEDGETSTFTLSARRKVRIFKNQANIDNFIRLIGPRQENRLLGGQ
jgi:hypothetical protein